MAQLADLTDRQETSNLELSGQGLPLSKTLELDRPMPAEPCSEPNGSALFGYQFSQPITRKAGDVRAERHTDDYTGFWYTYDNNNPYFIYTDGPYTD